METETKDPFLEEQEKENNRFVELNAKQDRSEDEQKELDVLKSDYGKKVQKKIGEYSGKLKYSESQLAEAQAERERLAQENEELKRAKEEAPPAVVQDETITHKSKQWFTDSTLMAKVANKEMTDQQAFQHQQQRESARVDDLVEKRVDEKLGVTQAQTEAQRDLEFVMGKHPNMFAKLKDGSPNPNFNPQDPDYVLANEIYSELNPHDPKRLSKAMKRAEQILGKNVNADVTDNISLPKPIAADRSTIDEPLTEVTKEEEELAVRTYKLGGQINPKTNRIYTDAESIEKFKKAKAGRPRRII